MRKFVYFRGAHAPSRAADGAPAVGRFNATPLRKRLFGRGRPNQHARARALPRLCFLLVAPFMSAFVLPHVEGITLDVALSRTLEKNPEIVQARIALEQAAGRRLIFRSAALPDLRMQGLAGLQGGKRANEPTLRPFAFARGFFSQPLFDAAVPASLRRGNIEVLIAEQRLNVAIVEQLHTTRIAFYTALYNDSLRALGEPQRQRLAENVTTQTDRYRAGQTDRAAIMSAQLLERELEPRIQDVQRAYEGALLTLATAMGEDASQPAAVARPTGDLQFASLSYDLASETASALSERADLQLARLLVRAAAEDQRIIEAQYYPELDAVVEGLGIPVTVRTANSGSALELLNDAPRRRFLAVSAGFTRARGGQRPSQQARSRSNAPSAR